MEITKNVFVSHHHKDDRLIDSLTSLLSRKDYSIRNSSIRTNPDNQERFSSGQVPESTIRRLLRMKMRWASTVIVIIGKETASRPWVNWEIEEAFSQGKTIVGVYENGLKEKVDLPPALNDLATSIVGWDSRSIISAIEGSPDFQNPDGTPRPSSTGSHSVC